MLNVFLNGGNILVQEIEETQGQIAYKRNDTIHEYAPFFQAVDGDESQMDVGYYCQDVFGDGSNNFYSATPDGTMTYTVME